jgi:membrane protein implicated in regulation of membrane protease activity
MNDPRIYAFRPPQTPLGRALFFVGVVALVVASFFVGIFILAVGLGIAVVMMVVRAVKRQVGDPPRNDGPNTFEGEVVIVEERETRLEDRDGDR